MAIGNNPTRERPGESACDVTILMPCLNEEHTLEGCIVDAKRLQLMLGAKGMTSEILVADNCSTDDSRCVAASNGARLVSVMERGYGNALRSGCMAAHGSFILIVDADGSYCVPEGMRLIERLLAGDQMCMGTRFGGTIHPGAMPWKNQWIGNPLLTRLLNILFRSPFSDTQCGMRAITRDASSRMKSRANGMEFASEMVIEASRLNLRTSEVPITLRKDARIRPPHLRPLKDGCRHLSLILRLAWHWRWRPGASHGGFSTRT